MQCELWPGEVPVSPGERQLAPATADRIVADRPEFEARYRDFGDLGDVPEPRFGNHQPEGEIAVLIQHAVGHAGYNIAYLLPAFFVGEVHAVRVYSLQKVGRAARVDGQRASGCELLVHHVPIDADKCQAFDRFLVTDNSTEALQTFAQHRCETIHLLVFTVFPIIQYGKVGEDAIGELDVHIQRIVEVIDQLAAELREHAQRDEYLLGSPSLVSEHGIEYIVIQRALALAQRQIYPLHGGEPTARSCEGIAKIGLGRCAEHSRTEKRRYFIGTNERMIARDEPEGATRA